LTEDNSAYLQNALVYVCGDVEMRGYLYWPMSMHRDALMPSNESIPDKAANQTLSEYRKH
jgi:hypothetical protein